MPPMIAASASTNGSGADVFYAIFGIVLYWLPSFVAWRRGVRNSGSIVVLNFFGFLVVTWIIALAMAFSDPGPRPQPPQPPSA